jgi:DNA-binding MarR family transcriptional regulator
MTSEDAPKPIAFGLLEDVLGFRMQRLRAALSAPMIVGMRRWGLRRGAFMVLALVEANPGLSQTALVRETGIQKTLLVALLHDLEERGLMVRQALASDRRHNQLFLTDAGHSAVSEMAAIVSRIEAPIHQTLSPVAVAQFKAALDCALAAIRQEGLEE